MRRRRRLFCSVFLVVAAVALAAGCKSTTVDNNRDEPPPRTAAGAPAPGAPEPPPLAYTPVGAGAATPGPRKLPTVAPIDWKGFPRESSGKYGYSGRVIQVTSTKTGTIGRAVRKAKPGDTIVIKPGTYRVGLIDDLEELTIETDGLVIRTPPGKRARLLPAKGANFGVFIKSSHVLIAGLDIEGFPNAAISVGDQYKTSKGIILRDITVRGPNDGKWHDGIVAYHDFREKGGYSVDGLVLQNVNVYEASMGISCNEGPCRSWWLENVRIRNAQGEGWGADGVAVERGENMVLINVEVMSATGDGLDVKASKVLIMNCNVHHVAKNGIKLWDGGDIINTLIHHLPNEAALVFDKAARYRFVNSVAAYICYGPDHKCYHSAAGYDTKAHQQLDVINSVFYKTYGAFFIGDNTRTTLRNNIFFDVRNGEFLVIRKGDRETKVTTESSARARKAAGMDASNRIADPRFVAPAKGDFRLRPNSPGIDGGTRTEQFPAHDIAGRPRIRGDAPDVGPFES